jgi:hypothetical protein
MPFPEKRQVTARRLAANRAAARKSTGPRTPQGQQRSAFNSFQHGGFAREDHILRQALARSGDDPDALDRRRQELASDWKPATAQQKLFIDDLAWLYWLRDRARRAFLESQARRLPQAQLHRDRRRFEARHRAPALSPSDYYPHGCATLPSSLDKFRTLREFLEDLQDYAARARWSQCDEGRAYPEGLLTFLYGKTPSTARGRQLRKLWKQCEQARAKADDPRAAHILALLAEERAALDEEEALFAREQQMELDEPQSPIDPLSETGQEMMRQLERLDRQINAKIRLLLRLEQRASAAAQAAPPSPTTEPAETAPSPAPAESGEMATPPPAACPPPTASPRREGEDSSRSNPNQALESIARPGVEGALCNPATDWRSLSSLIPPDGDEHLASEILLGYSNR